MTRIRIGDLILVVLSLSLIAGVSLSVYQGSGGAPELHIRVDDREWIYAMDTDRDVIVSGPLGDTLVEIRDGRAHVHESPCRAKICIATGEISKPGEWILCLPNHVLVTIEGRTMDSSEVDAVVY
jgi:hypothetical protein